MFSATLFQFHNADDTPVRRLGTEKWTNTEVYSYLDLWLRTSYNYLSFSSKRKSEGGQLSQHLKCSLKIFHFLISFHYSHFLMKDKIGKLSRAFTCVSFTCKSVHHMGFWCWCRLKEGVLSPRTEVMDGCVSSCECWKIKLSSLRKQQMLNNWPSLLPRAFVS